MSKEKAKQPFEGLESYDKGYEDGVMDATRYCIKEITKAITNILQIDNSSMKITIDKE